MNIKELKELIKNIPDDYIVKRAYGTMHLNTPSSGYSVKHMTSNVVEVKIDNEANRILFFFERI